MFHVFPERERNVNVERDHVPEHALERDFWNMTDQILYFFLSFNFT